MDEALLERNNQRGQIGSSRAMRGNLRTGARKRIQGSVCAQSPLLRCPTPGQPEQAAAYRWFCRCRAEGRTHAPSILESWTMCPVRPIWFALRSAQHSPPWCLRGNTVGMPQGLLGRCSEVGKPVIHREVLGTSPTCHSGTDRQGSHAWRLPAGGVPRSGREAPAPTLCKILKPIGELGAT